MLKCLSNKQLIRLRAARLDRYWRLRDLFGVQYRTCVVVGNQLDRLNRELVSRGFKAKTYSNIGSSF